jgi:hypothetical protein
MGAELKKAPPQTEENWQKFIDWSAIDAARQAYILSEHKPGETLYETKVTIESGPYAGMVITISYTPSV